MEPQTSAEDTPSVSVARAAELLNISEGAVRYRIREKNLPVETEIVDGKEVPIKPYRIPLDALLESEGVLPVIAQFLGRYFLPDLTKKFDELEILIRGVAREVVINHRDQLAREQTARQAAEEEVERLKAEIDRLRRELGDLQSLYWPHPDERVVPAEATTEPELNGV